MVYHAVPCDFTKKRRNLKKSDEDISNNVQNMGTVNLVANIVITRPYLMEFLAYKERWIICIYDL